MKPVTTKQDRQDKKEELKRKLINLVIDERALRDGIVTLPSLSDMARINSLVYNIWDPKDN